jgi:hypothetical protein
MSTATVEITLDAEATGRVVPGSPAVPPAYAHGGLPPEPASVEDLRITLYLPAKCIGPPDMTGHVLVDVTSLVPEMDTDAAIDALIEADDEEPATSRDYDYDLHD